ncbi:MAG TPA: hypothetical protein VJT31_00305, partial [Rugosimonospora sp.]|nr:hypothetical protein [Rugosimonospora sp.]
MSTPEATPGQPPTGAVPWYPVVGFPASPPPERPRRRRLFTAVAVAWALLLLGTGLWYALHGEPTVRDQTTIAQAQPRVDEAVGTVLAAAGTGPVAAVSGFQKASDCAVTPVRAGARYQRSVLLYTAVGGEGELLSTIAAGLPPRYHARVDRSGLVADAGYYVLVTGDAPQPGVVRVIAATGCR